jgi:hypothetical protein
VRRTAAAVDGAISDLVVNELSKPGAADLLRPKPRPGVDARKLRAEARKLRDRKTRLARLYAAGDIDDADLAEGSRAIGERLAEINARLAASDEADPLAEFRGQPAATVWAGLTMARRRAVVQTLIASVVIKRAGRRGQGFDPDTVDITWRV